METLSIIAYKQPVTRGDIEAIRGVSVSSSIMRTLNDRNWVRIIGYRDVPGKPAMFSTTPEFLDYFGLKKLEELPELPATKEPINYNLDLESNSLKKSERSEDYDEIDNDNDSDGWGSGQGFLYCSDIGIITTLFSVYFFARHLSSFYVMRSKNKKISIWLLNYLKIFNLVIFTKD